MKTLRLSLVAALALFAVAAGGAQQPPQPPEDPLARVLFPPELVMQHQQDIGLRSEQRATITKAIQDFQTKVVDPQWRMQEQSQRLANNVQRSLYGTLSVLNPGLRDRGIKEAGFVVLSETAMPGILAEVSFVSSPTDEQKLRSDGYREQIVEALYKGIARYAASSHGVKVASAAN